MNRKPVAVAFATALGVCCLAGVSSDATAQPAQAEGLVGFKTLKLSNDMGAKLQQRLKKFRFDKNDNKTEAGRLAWSKKGKMPKGAKKLTAATFKKLVQKGDIVLESPSLRKEWANERKNRRARKRAFLERHMKDHAADLSRLLRKATGVREAGDVYFHSVELSDGSTAEVPTMSEEWLEEELANSAEDFSNRANKVNVYNDLYAQAKPGARTKLKKPVELANASDEAVEQQLEAVAENEATAFTPAVGTAGKPTSCLKEVGQITKTLKTGEGDSASLCTYKATGIMKNTNFALKKYLTCVKSQGARGSCVAFGITGAIETAYAKKQNRYYNFSEQEFYARNKLSWFPNSWYDGLPTHDVIKKMISSKWGYAWEKTWYYNQSRWRKRLDNGTLSNSCQNYSGRHCSNPVHQGQRYCTKVKFLGITIHTYCGYRETAANTRYGVTKASYIWNPSNTTLSTTLAKLYALIGRPMVASLAVVGSFDAASGNNGYINYAGDNESSRGGHAVALVGYVPNSALPTGAPKGDGEGYFVIKNSWGCWGDGGYAYISPKWARKWFSGLTVVQSVR